MLGVVLAWELEGYKRNLVRPTPPILLQKQVCDLLACPPIIRRHSCFLFLRLVDVLIMDRARFVLGIEVPVFVLRVTPALVDGSCF